MPAEQRVRRDDRGDLAQHLTAHPDGALGESPALVIGETQAPPTQLPAQEEIFFDQVGDHLSFAALELAGQDQQQHLDGCGADHERELKFTADGFRPSQQLDQVVGQNGLGVNGAKVTAHRADVGSSCSRTLTSAW